MFRLDAVLIRGNYFKHNAHKAAIIVVHLHAFYILFLVINIMFSYFTAVLMCWVKFGDLGFGISILVIVYVLFM